jgi:hypothetical protein
MIVQPTTRSRAAVAAAITLAVMGLSLYAQPRPDAAELGARLRERYEIVVLQGGIGLVPRQRDASFRLIEIRNGAVTINGDEQTGRQLRERLGADAELVLQASYLDADGQRQLAATTPSLPDIAPPPPPQPDVPSPSPSPSRVVRRTGEIVRVGGNVQVARDELVQDEVIVVFGSATIDGEVEGEVTVVMGSLTLGPEAIVHGEVNVIGGRLNRSPTARIDGDVHNVGFGGRGVVFNNGSFRDAMRNAFVWRVGGLAATLLRVTLLMLLALAVVAFGPRVVERIADRTAADPVRAGLVGICAELLFFPVVIVTIVVLAVSIIGIPLLVLVPFGIVFALVVLLVGFTGVAYHVGRLLNARFGWGERGAYASVALGVIVIAALTVLARSASLVGGGVFGFPLVAIGLLVEYAAWTVGFGAAILAWFRRRQQPPRVEVPAIP